MNPKGEQLDPELDVEAQFSRRAVRNAQSSIYKRERLKFLSGWLYCKLIDFFLLVCVDFFFFLYPIGCGGVFVVLYVIYPLAMIIIGK